MNKTLCSGLAVGMMISFMTAHSHATSIPIAQVGSVDILVGKTTLQNSGDKTETNYVESVFGGYFTIKFNNDSSESNWLAASGSGVDPGTYAYYFSDIPEHSLTKTGNNGSDELRDFLSQNISGLDYAVINLVAFGIKNTGKISHIDGFLDPLPPLVTAPEPTTMLLLGTGLTGLASVRRRKTA